jgi:hypothetical protein
MSRVSRHARPSAGVRSRLTCIQAPRQLRATRVRFRFPRISVAAYRPRVGRAREEVGEPVAHGRQREFHVVVDEDHHDDVPGCHLKLIVTSHIDADHIDAPLGFLEGLPDGVESGYVWFNGARHLPSGVLWQPRGRTSRSGSRQGPALAPGVRLCGGGRLEVGRRSSRRGGQPHPGPSRALAWPAPRRHGGRL